MPLPDSSARGRLIIDDGCIRLRSLFPTYGFAIGSSTLLIWPHGYAAGVIDGKTVVLDEKGEVVANVGMTVFVGGGNVSREIIEANIEHPLPEACHGPYWVVSSVKAE